jgi:peptide deformylase
LRIVGAIVEERVFVQSPNTLYFIPNTFIMPPLPIITGADHPVLRAKATPVRQVTKQIRNLAKDMEATLAEAKGIGLAAPQVGESVRLCLVQIGGRIVPIINPDILQRSEETAMAEEGCLSLPNVWVPVERSVSIVVRYQDLTGAWQERRLTDLEARITQHEIDHLHGILIVDYAPNARVM